MSWDRRRTVLAVVVALAAGVAAGVAIGLTENDETEPAAVDTAPLVTDTRTAEPEADEPEPERANERLPPPEEDPEGLEPGPSGEPPESPDERAATAAARAYIGALRSRRASAVCGAFSQGALDRVKFPRRRDSCAATVRASLGYRDPRGFPVWKSSAMTDDVSAKVDGDSARVVATVLTKYADVREPTIEDDVIYLGREGDRWLIAKASATLYRAIGNTDVPPSVLAPPK